jgi:3-hydroxyisobutyrate dehydrogenase/putative dehydrogenase
MARLLLGRVDAVRVYDPLKQHVERLVAEGAEAADSPRAAAEGADLLFVMVATPQQADQALFGPENAAATLQPGAALVVLSTIGPAAVRGLAERLPAGVELLDAPVSGGVVRAETGELVIMAAGAPALFERLRPLLERLGTRVVLVGETIGDGQAVKVVNQLLCGVHIAAAAEALGLALALGLEPRAVWEVIRHGAAGSFMLDDRGARMLDGAFEPVKSALNIFVKDMSLVTAAGRERRFATPLAAAAEQLYLMGAGAGLGHLDDSAIVTLYEHWAGRPLAGAPEED